MASAHRHLGRGYLKAHPGGNIPDICPLFKQLRLIPPALCCPGAVCQLLFPGKLSFQRIPGPGVEVPDRIIQGQKVFHHGIQGPFPCGSRHLFHHDPLLSCHFPAVSKKSVQQLSSVLSLHPNTSSSPVLFYSTTDSSLRQSQYLPTGPPSAFPHPSA